MKKHLLLTLLVAWWGNAAAQLPAAAGGKIITERQQVWLGYFNQVRLSKRWGIWFDVHLRTNNFTSELSLNFYRVGALYYLRDNLRLTAGYSLGLFFPEGEREITRLEHRPWQQIWYASKIDNLNTLQWIRVEQRYNQVIRNPDTRTGDYDFNWRIRYNLTVQIPLSSKRTKLKNLFGVIQDEVFINVGSAIRYNTFDQNRFFVGLSYQLSARFNTQLGYMNVWQQRATGLDYFNTHTLRLFMFHNLDLRKKEEKPADKG